MVPVALLSWWASTSSRQAELTAYLTPVWLRPSQPLRPSAGPKSLVGQRQWRVLIRLCGWNQTIDQKSSRTGLINMTAGERVVTHQSIDTMRSPPTDGETCQSHQTERNTDETGRENLTEIGGIVARPAVVAGAPLTLVAEVINLVTGLLLLEILVGAALDKMAPNLHLLPLVLNSQIRFLFISWEAIVAHWRTSRSLRWSGLTKTNIHPSNNHSAITACDLPKQITPITLIFKHFFLLLHWSWIRKCNLLLKASVVRKNSAVCQNVTSLIYSLFKLLQCCEQRCSSDGTCHITHTGSVWYGLFHV